MFRDCRLFHMFDVWDFRIVVFADLQISGSACFHMVERLEPAREPWGTRRSRSDGNQRHTIEVKGSKQAYKDDQGKTSEREQSQAKGKRRKAKVCEEETKEVDYPSIRPQQKCSYTSGGPGRSWGGPGGPGGVLEDPGGSWGGPGVLRGPRGVLGGPAGPSGSSGSETHLCRFVIGFL